MALVRWCGFNPETGKPWDDSWEPRGNLTEDLRSSGLLRQRRVHVRGQERDQQSQRVGSRKSPRVAGEAPGRALGEPYVSLSWIVLCAGTFGGWCLGVGRDAEWRCNS